MASEGFCEIQKAMAEAWEESLPDLLFQERENSSANALRSLIAALINTVTSIEYRRLRPYLKTELDFIRFVLANWDPADRMYRRSRLLDAAIRYETGDYEGAGDSVFALCYSTQGPENPMRAVPTGFAQEAWEGIFALQLGPCLGDDPLCNLTSGLLRLGEGNIQRALEELHRALNAHPGWRAAQQGIEIALMAVPQAIGALIQEGDLVAAAALAGELTDNRESGEWMAKIATQLEVAGDSQAAIAQLEAAVRRFNQAGTDDRATACKADLCRLRRQPVLDVTWEPPEGLTLGEWDLIPVTIANVGYGLARNLTVTVDGPVTSEGAVTVFELAPGESQRVEIAIRPDNAGRAVPITAKVSYEDSVGTQVLPPITKRFRVARAEGVN
jgi:tetratricopeptide (TPR) repeat protein